MESEKVIIISYDINIGLVWNIPYFEVSITNAIYIS